jgi:hypothetical protein
MLTDELVWCVLAYGLREMMNYRMIDVATGVGGFSWSDCASFVAFSRTNCLLGVDELESQDACNFMTTADFKLLK